MVYSIIISGLYSDNQVLFRSISYHANRVINKPFHGYELLFKSRTAAIRALSAGYQILTIDHAGWKFGNNSYKYAHYLKYGNSRAEIVPFR